MERAHTELVNELRTASVGHTSGVKIRQLADQLEAALLVAERSQSVIHTKLAQQGSELAGAKSELVEQGSKLAAAKRELAKQGSKLTATQGALTAAKAELAELEEKLSLAEEKIRLLLAIRFGPSRERWTDTDERQALLFPELEAILAKEVPEPEVGTEQEEGSESQEAPNESGKPERNGRVLRGKRRPLPDSLPRVETRVELPESERQCPECGKVMEAIGEDASERLQAIPVRFYVERTIRPRYVCSCGCGGVKQAAVPVQVFPKSIIGESVAAQVVTGKFCDGLPLYRQARVLEERFGVGISEQTLGRAAKAVATILEPLSQKIHEGLARCPVVCGDETRLRVLHEDGKQKEGLSWMWVLTGDDAGRRYVRYRYDGGRGNEAGRALLAGYRGTVMADGYGVYTSLAKEMGLRRAACMVHVRRKFLEVLKANPKNSDAQTALAMIRSLYQVESTYATSTAQERLLGRQTHAVPIFERFTAWLREKVPKVRPKSLLGTAVNYAHELLPSLGVYLEDGKVPIDNGAAERAIRPFVVGRKAWLFNDQAHGAETSATLYSIIETVKANGLEPYHYLLFILRCYERFGADGMDWTALFPNPKIRDYADRIGVPWAVPG